MASRAAAVAAAALAVAVFAGPARAAAPSPGQVAYQFAVGQAGKPFQWGADGPAAFDCSGLVYAAYLHAGVVLPRDTYGMAGSRDLVRITRSQARQGDLVFFGPASAPDHVALVDAGDVVFSAYRPGQPAGWSRTGRYWEPSAYYRVAVER